MLKEKRPKQPPHCNSSLNPFATHCTLCCFCPSPLSRILCKSKHFVQIVNVVRPSTHTSNNNKLTSDNNKNNLDYNNNNNKNCGNKGFRLLHAF